MKFFQVLVVCIASALLARYVDSVTGENPKVLVWLIGWWGGMIAGKFMDGKKHG